MSGDFSFLKGNIYTIILCSLYGKDGNGDKYGYEIAKEIKERTENKYEIKQPTLYAYLKKLEQQGSIESYWGAESNGGRRRYYKLTEKGRGDCERFIAEWEYHKTVLSTLVDTPDSTIDISQSDVTPLFGEKQKRTKKVASTKEMEEQDEIARKLAALLGSDDEDVSNNTQNEVVNTAVVEETQNNEQEVVEEIVEEEILSDDDGYVETFDDEDQNEIVEDDVYADITTNATPAVVEVTRAHETQQDNLRAKFDVKQDNADDFMQQFDERARVLAETRDVQTDSAENYQHVLMNVIGDQLNEMRDYSSEQIDGAQKYYTDHPVALEDVADSLAKEGIRLRIYNHASSNFKSKTLMPVSNVLCKTAWLTYAIAVVYFCVLIFTSLKNNNWLPFVITLAATALLPISFTVYALYDPSRKEKPRFVFKRVLIGTIIIATIVVLLAFSISVIAHVELSDYAAISKSILIPTGLAVLIPSFVAIYNAFYKKY